MSRGGGNFCEHMSMQDLKLFGGHCAIPMATAGYVNVSVARNDFQTSRGIGTTTKRDYLWGFRPGVIRDSAPLRGVGRLGVRCGLRFGGRVGRLLGQPQGAQALGLGAK